MGSELRQIVAEDLAHLRDSWGNGDVTDSVLRRDSVILRRLLVAGDLQNAWEEQGNERDIRISGLQFTPDLGGIPRGAIDHMQTGEVSFPNGAVSYGVVVLAKILDYGPVFDEIDLPLQEYLDAPVIYTGLAQVRRRHVINYFANKRGGAHFDSRRNRRGDHTFEILDAVFAEFELMERNAFYLALLSTGQDLCRSRDVQLLMRPPAEQ